MFWPLPVTFLGLSALLAVAGPVLVLGVSGGSDREELLRFRTPSSGTTDD